MTNRLSLEMLKATRLTRAGRLVAATEFLQRVLQGESPVPATDEAVGDPIEVTIKNYNLSLRKKEAEGISVEVVK